MDTILAKKNTNIWSYMNTLNYKRIRYFSIILFIIVSVLLVLDNNNRLAGLWNSHYVYKLYFYLHISALLLATFGILINLLTKTQTNIYILIFIFLVLNISALLSGWVSPYLHTSISVYIISCFCMTILFSIRPKYSILFYSQSYLLLIGGLFINVANLEALQVYILNASIVLPLSILFSIMLFRYTEKEYLYKYNLEYLVKERTTELLDANNLLELEISDRERMQTERVEQLTKYLTLEAELSKSNKLIADIIKDMPDGFYVLDNRWQFMFVNKKAEELLLKTREELLGQVFWNVRPQTKGTLLEFNFEKARNNRVPITFDFRNSLQGDTWYQITVFPCQFGLSVYYKDITEQKLSREKLKESQEETVSILESMTDCFFAIDREWRFTYINRAGEKFFGKSRDELLDREITELTFNEISLQNYWEVMNKKMSVSFEVISKTLDGKWIEENVYPTENGGLTCYFREITNRKKADCEIARLERLNLVGLMSAGIAHEIRNPMFVVRGYLQLLCAKPAYVDQKSTFDLMIAELDRANAIITEFLSLAQMKQTELKSQNLNNIINSLYPLLEADAFTQNKQISFIQGEIPNLKLNGNEISQLVLNLVRNGLESMSERGYLFIRSCVEGDKVVLSIEDEGSGISQENLNKLGTPFFTTKDTGTGLGLATSYKIAESHNAKIHINSSSSGTTFCIFFPIPEKGKGQDGMIA